MSMADKTGPINNPLKITLQGPISGESLFDTEQQILADITQSSATDVILDLVQSDYIDSRGISFCIRIYKQCEAKGIGFSIEVNYELYHVFAATNLIRTLRIRQIK